MADVEAPQHHEGRKTSRHRHAQPEHENAGADERRLLRPRHIAEAPERPADHPVRRRAAGLHDHEIESEEAGLEPASMAQSDEVHGVGQKPPGQHEHTCESRTDQHRTGEKQRRRGDAECEEREACRAEQMSRRQQPTLVVASRQHGPEQHAEELPARYGDQQGAHAVGAMKDVSAHVEQHPLESRHREAGDRCDQPHAEDQPVTQRHGNAVPVAVLSVRKRLLAPRSQS